MVEAALAHKTPDAVQAAYRRTTYLGTPDQPGARVKLMTAWGRYCASGAAGTGNVKLSHHPDSRRLDIAPFPHTLARGEDSGARWTISINGLPNRFCPMRAR